MSLIKRMRKQKAVWWKRAAADFRGEFAFEDPVEIKCRWEDTITEYKPLGAGPGEVALSNSTVYVDRDMKEGDYLQLGPLESSTPADPRAAAGSAFEIVAFEKLPNLKAKEFLRTARL